MTSRSLHRPLRLVVVVPIVAALLLLAPSVSAAPHRAFHLTKTCNAEGTLCIVQSSTYADITPGTEITYVWASDVIALPTITLAGGSTTGVCDWSHPTGPILARCSFESGTGTLTGFHLDVRVTATADFSLWYWDGTYSFASSD
jgi:hypothetical protein